MRIPSINVTALTRARLGRILEWEVDVIAIQETRHCGGPMTWAAKEARRAGYECAWSAPPDHVGGALIAWRRTLDDGGAVLFGRCSRLVGKVIGNVSVVCGYGPAHDDGGGWFVETVAALHEVPGAVVLVGDLNWRSSYAVGDPLAVTDGRSTVVAGRAAPTRVIFARCDVRRTGEEPVPGITHHQAVFFEVGAEATRRDEEYKLRRTADFVADTDLDETERHQLQEELGGECRRLEEWHARTEEVFHWAVRRGAVRAAASAERPKGSDPTVRPRCPPKRGHEEDSVRLRRLKRLHRSLAHTLRDGPNRRLEAHQERHWRAALEDRAGGRRVERMPDSIEEGLEIASAGVTEEDKKRAEERVKKWRQRFYGDEQIRAAKSY